MNDLMTHGYSDDLQDKLAQMGLGEGKVDIPQIDPEEVMAKEQREKDDIACHAMGVDNIDEFLSFIIDRQENEEDESIKVNVVKAEEKSTLTEKEVEKLKEVVNDGSFDKNDFHLNEEESKKESSRYGPNKASGTKATQKTSGTTTSYGGYNNASSSRGYNSNGYGSTTSNSSISGGSFARNIKVEPKEKEKEVINSADASTISKKLNNFFSVAPVDRNVAIMVSDEALKFGQHPVEGWREEETREVKLQKSREKDMKLINKFFSKISRFSKTRKFKVTCKVTAMLALNLAMALMTRTVEFESIGQMLSLLALSSSMFYMSQELNAEGVNIRNMRTFI